MVILAGVVAAVSLIVAVVFQVLHYRETLDDTDYTEYGCISAVAFYIFLISFFLLFGSG